MKVVGGEVDRISTGGGAAGRGGEEGGETGEAGFEASLIQMLETPEEPVSPESEAVIGESEQATEEAMAAQPEQAVAVQGAVVREGEAPEARGGRLVQSVDAAGSSGAPRESNAAGASPEVPRDFEAPGRREGSRSGDPVDVGREVDAARDREARSDARAGREARPDVETARDSRPDVAVARDARNDAGGGRDARPDAQTGESARVADARLPRDGSNDPRQNDSGGERPPRQAAGGERVASADPALARNAEGFAEAAGREPAAPPVPTQSEALAASVRSDVPVQPAVAAVAAPPVAIEPAVDIQEPAAPSTPSRPLPAEAIPQHIEWLTARGGGTAQIQLYPPELGKLAIQVTVRGDEVKVVMNVREAAAQTVVAEYRDTLENSLASKDLKLDAFEVRDWRERGEGVNRQGQHADRDADPRGGRDRGEEDGEKASSGIAGALTPPAHAATRSEGDYARNVNLHI